MYQIITFLGYLKFKKLKYVLIDWSFKDGKQRQMVDIKEVCLKNLLCFLYFFIKGFFINTCSQILSKYV